MKPPKCRNCGAEEWRHVCGGSNVSVGRSRVTRFDTPPTAEPRVANVANRPVANSEAERVRKWRLANRERYNARERERMRAVRAGKRVSP